MEVKDEMIQVYEKGKGLFTPARLKMIGAVLVVGACCAGGGAWYYHQQKEMYHVQVAAARAVMTEAQAQKLGVALLPENAIRTLAAKAIGQEEGNVTYRKVHLQEKGDREQKAKHKDGDMVQERSVPTAFHPVYKVVCLANHVKYKLVMDAVTGEVLKSRVG